MDAELVLESRRETVGWLFSLGFSEEDAEAAADFLHAEGDVSEALDRWEERGLHPVEQASGVSSLLRCVRVAELCREAGVSREELEELYRAGFDFKGVASETLNDGVS